MVLGLLPLTILAGDHFVAGATAPATQQPITAENVDNLVQVGATPVIEPQLVQWS